MPYDRLSFDRDVDAAWKQAKPHIKKGLKAPLAAATDMEHEATARELKHWLKGWVHGFLYLGKLGVSFVRLKLNV